MVLEAHNTCEQETRSAKNHRRAEKRAAKRARTAAASDAETREHSWYEEGKVRKVTIIHVCAASLAAGRS
jgi:hypothetical protein